MYYKYCSNCRSENSQERKFCFFCEGLTFVDSLDELSGKITKRKVVPESIEKVELLTEGKENIVKKNSREFLTVEIDAKQLEELIEAQNRTTHAVRAFVRFLFIQLSGITAAFVIWSWSQTFVDQQQCYTSGTNCGGNAFLQIVAVLIWIGSIVLSSYAGWSELEKSEVY